MGIEYFIVDEIHTECFDLGKGNWNKLPLTNSDDILKWYEHKIDKNDDIK